MSENQGSAGLTARQLEGLNTLRQAILEHSLEFQPLIYTILSGITAEMGLGFNRAAVFLYNPATRESRGVRGLGPITGQQASDFWRALRDQSRDLDRIVEFNMELNRNNMFTFDNLIKTLKLGADRPGLMRRAAVDRQTVIYREDPALGGWEPESDAVLGPEDISAAEREFLRFDNIAECILSPMAAGGKTLGAVYADNKITGSPIAGVGALKQIAAAGAAALNISNLLNEKVQNERRLEQKNRLINRYISQFTHQLKNPLTSIQGYVRTILDDAGDREFSREQIYEFLAAVDQESEKLVQSIQQILDLQKFRVGEARNRQVCEVPALIQAAVAEVRSLARDRDIKLGVEAREGVDEVTVYADRRELIEALTNLLHNAVRYADFGGKVTVRAERVDEGRNGRAVRVTVSDNGVGIDPDEIDLVFQEFYRGRKTSHIPGSGEGLFVVKNIIEEHGGEVELRSEPGVGSTFSVTLPVL